LVAGGFLLWHWVIHPFKRIGRRLEAMARGETEPAIRRRLPPPFGRVERNLGQLEDRMEEMQQQLNDESMNMRTILGSMVEGVLIVDGRQQIRLINSGMLAMVPGHPNPMNRSIMEVFRNHELQQAVSSALEKREAVHRELSFDVHVGEDYRTKHFAITCVPLQQPERDAAMGAILVFHDITRLKELEAIRREFVANVSHEIRTPLSILKGYLETLLDGALEDQDQSRKFCETMLRHTDRLNLLIEDVLSLSKLESGRAGLEIEPIDLEAVCHGIKESLEQKITAQQAEFLFDIDPELPRLQADPHQLDQILFNLFDNALKYHGAKPLRLRVSARQCDAWIEIQVQDNGPGIPLEDQPHIFERFYRVHKDRARDAGGTGLGLSIVKHATAIHGGSVDLQSEPGKGATFILRFPIEQISEKTHPQSVPNHERFLLV